MPKTRSWGNLPTNPEDPEFEAKVRATLGPKYAKALRRDKATFIPTSDELNLKGLYTRPNSKSSQMIEQLRAYTGVDFSFKPDQVYGVGAGATPSTWAHEFRHRGGIQDEGSNRTLDALLADSPKKWKEAVIMDVDRRARFNDLPSSYEEAEQDLADRLEKYAHLYSEDVGYEPTFTGQFTGENKRKSAVAYPYRHFAPKKEK